MIPPYALTDPSVAAFVLIPGALVVLLVWGVAVAWRRAGLPASTRFRAVTLALGGSTVWMTATWLVAQNGVLLDWDRTPPPFAILVVAILVLAAGLVFGPVGRHFAAHLPFTALVGVQAFRLPLELAMHRLMERGIMPAQMSYSGRNWDIVTGATAIVVALLVSRGLAGRRLVAIWNFAGLALLANIIVIAIISTPRIHYFGLEHLNVFVMRPPFVWLPAVMVLAALAGHGIVLRKLMIWRSGDLEI